MPNLPAEKSDKAETAQPEPCRSFLRWALIPTILWSYAGLTLLYAGAAFLESDLPRSGVAFAITGVVWLYAARCWWIGKFKRGICVTILCFYLGSCIALLPATEKEFLRDPVKADLR